MNKPLDVEILGQKLTISSDSEESYMLRVAGYVDGKMQQLLQSPKPIARSNIAVLAALNIADEYHRLKEAHEAMLSKVDQLCSRLETSLTEEA
jgi:cell division protein ZapA